MANVRIRAAEAADLPAILALYGELEGPYECKDGENPDIWQLWQAVDGEKGQYVLVAERKGEVVGTLTVVVIPNLGHHGTPWAAVENVVVDRRFRDQGIGTALMIEAGEIARRAHCYKVVVSSNLIRTDAHEFYRRLGWKQTHIGFSVEIS